MTDIEKAVELLEGLRKEAYRVKRDLEEAVATIQSTYERLIDISEMYGSDFYNLVERNTEEKEETQG